MFYKRNFYIFTIIAFFLINSPVLAVKLVKYRIRSGDTPRSVFIKFNLTSSDLKEIKKLNPKFFVRKNKGYKMILLKGKTIILPFKKKSKKIKMSFGTKMKSTLYFGASKGDYTEVIEGVSLNQDHTTPFALGGALTYPLRSNRALSLALDISQFNGARTDSKAEIVPSPEVLLYGRYLMDLRSFEKTIFLIGLDLDLINSFNSDDLVAVSSTDEVYSREVLFSLPLGFIYELPLFNLSTQIGGSFAYVPLSLTKRSEALTGVKFEGNYNIDFNDSFSLLFSYRKYIVSAVSKLTINRLGVRLGFSF